MSRSNGSVVGIAYIYLYVLNIKTSNRRQKLIEQEFDISKNKREMKAIKQ